MAVPQALRDGSLALGSTTNETIRKVIVPAALPGIVAGIMLAVSRAIGETMIVVMAASTAANLSANPLDSMTTVTVQIVALLTLLPYCLATAAVLVIGVASDNIMKED